MQGKEVKSKMPKALLDFLGYTFYFYSNENGEPIHIHVSKGKPSENSTKFWIKRDGVANKAIIVNRWYEYFGF